MTTDIEQINNHTFRVTRDDSGNIINQVAFDPSITVPDPPIKAKIQALIVTLAAGAATPAQQQKALALILASLINLTDVQ